MGGPWWSRPSPLCRMDADLSGFDRRGGPEIVVGERWAAARAKHVPAIVTLGDLLFESLSRDVEPLAGLLAPWGTTCARHLPAQPHPAAVGWRGAAERVDSPTRAGPHRTVGRGRSNGLRARCAGLAWHPSPECQVGGGHLLGERGRACAQTRRPVPTGRWRSVSWFTLSSRATCRSRPWSVVTTKSTQAPLLGGGHDRVPS